MINQNIYNFAQNILKLQELIIPFIRQIVEDCYDKPNEIYYKLGLENEFYKIGLFNKETNQTAIKHIKIEEFLRDFQDTKKFELKMNILIREMIIKLEEKNENNVVNM